MPAVGRDGMSTTQGSTTMYQITSSNPDGEYTDQELLNLVNYFEVSRVELKNVGKYFLFIFREKKNFLDYIDSVLIHYLHNQFLKQNKLIPKHRNYLKVKKSYDLI
jgi:hypothetical protein